MISATAIAASLLLTLPPGTNAVAAEQGLTGNPHPSTALLLGVTGQERGMKSRGNRERMNARRYAQGENARKWSRGKDTSTDPPRPDPMGKAQRHDWGHGPQGGKDVRDEKSEQDEEKRRGGRSKRRDKRD